MKIKWFSAKNLTLLPVKTGVYLFASGKQILYIGKATNIKSLVKNHFQQPTFKDALFVGQISRVGYIKTNSEIEALILESQLIKKYRPKYNVIWKDDKNYFYVVITREKLPRIYITHQPFVASSPQVIPTLRVVRLEQDLRPLYKRDEGTERNEVQTTYIGPFVDGKALKRTLRFVRRIFPYYTLRHS